MKELKDYQRTIRMTQTTRKYLEKSEGNGLNEKFENLVHAAYIKEKELKERNDYLEEENKELEQELKIKRQLLYDKLKDVETHINKLFTIQ
ncbi:MAG: hypothetical protein LBE23_00765 [Vagococcus sp.]|jgi:hypothetical protein|nr:hypothetical protein [Vagococcus sp.]